MQVKREKDGLILASACEVADSMFARMRGLLLHTKLNEREGLWIRSCNSVHTFFMRFSIDVLFLNKKNEVVHIVSSLRPWRMTRIFFTANSVIELPAGWCEKMGIHKGDILSITNTSSAIAREQ